MSKLAVTSIISICMLYLISALPVDLARDNELDLSYDDIPNFGSPLLTKLYLNYLLRDNSFSPRSSQQTLSKRGIGPCINNCLKAGGRMNFIQCKSMCHWIDSKGFENRLSFPLIEDDQLNDETASRNILSS
ncbi:hypothetical protein LOTGIDRAFT_234124 [Lottia gigantea]|uniref:Uncharacterized protein n=1 Tax=Lottia gigantea TaxID=225164 RepID=V4A8T8_LOTGI|nr:hypothetical protein LOTGIDRAFT_234124 [Lottia gigantea]ESO89721.1 hypothetical protein LOTGIDRAFT_234124 [Lottia gigantea]